MTRLHKWWNLDASTAHRGGRIMWWGIGIGAAFVYFLIALTLGLMTLRNGHGWMFFFGIFFPILWIIGAFMRPPEKMAPV
jgi:hypothetical protein